MSRKLLDRTLKYYLSYSLVVMLFGALLFYFVSHFLYLEDADEGLRLLKKEFVKNSVPKLKQSDIAIWNKFNRDVKIHQGQKNLKEDILFYKSYYDTLDKENEPYRVLISPVVINGKPHVFFARVNLVENKDLILGTVILFIVIISILHIGLFSITKRLSLKLWRPFYETLAQIEAFEIDKNSNLKFTENKTEEFNRLNQAIIKLIEKNTNIYRIQKEFIENAAHELQTPIAILKGRIDVLLQRSDVTKGQFEILDKLNNTTVRLKRLNKNLLLLSKIESNLFDSTDNVNLGEIIGGQLDFFTEQALAKNIAIETNLESNIIVKSNQLLAEILISNLFLNAINHNIENGKIKVLLNTNTLIFSNTGDSKSLETSKLFERFSKVNPSSKGHGLGLSIIKKIIDNNQWNIEYTFKDGLHHFEIHL